MKRNLLVRVLWLRFLVWRPSRLAWRDLRAAARLQTAMRVGSALVLDADSTYFRCGEALQQFILNVRVRPVYSGGKPVPARGQWDAQPLYRFLYARGEFDRADKQHLQ